MNKKVLKMIKDLSYKTGDEARKNIVHIKVNGNPVSEKNASDENTVDNEKFNILTFFKDIFGSIVDAFSHDITVLNVCDMRNAISAFIRKTIFSLIFYIGCGIIITVVPIKCGYLLSIPAVIPMIIFFLIIIAINEARLYGTYMVPVKHFREYKKNKDAGLFE